MDDANYLALLGKITALEARIEKLERAADISIISIEAAKLFERYPYMMSKNDAARALGVTRGTVYAMIKDGRLEVNSIGKIPTRSVAECMTAKAKASA